MRSLLVCLSVLVAFKITKVNISCIITYDSGPYCSNFIKRIRIYNAKKKKRRTTQSGYELKVRELFESIFRVIMTFFLSVVDKIQTIRARTTCNNARNLDFVILQATSTGRQTRRLRIFKIFASVWHQIAHARDS